VKPRFDTLHNQAQRRYKFIKNDKNYLSNRAEPSFDEPFHIKLKATLHQKNDVSHLSNRAEPSFDEPFHIKLKATPQSKKRQKLSVKSSGAEL
jgi:hypothetical protein